MFAVLAARTGRAVSQDELIDAVWGESVPATARSALYTYIARLRRALEPARPPRVPAGVLASAGSGYSLRLVPSLLDVEIFNQLLTRARSLRAAEDTTGAIAAFDTALQVHHGSPWAGIPGPFAAAERDRLGEQYVAAVEDRAEVMISAGQHASVIAELSRLLREHPYRERQAGILMLALYRTGRQAEALALYHETRRRLVADLGVEPGHELRKLHSWILDGSLAVGIVTGPEPAEPVTPHQLPRDVVRFIGRSAELRAITAPGGPGADGGAALITAIGGLGGAGKSALAIHAAHLLAGGFPDGQLYVDLRGARPGVLPLQPLAGLQLLLRGVGVPAQEIPADLDAASARWRTAAAGRRLLVVFDNASCSRQVLPLLPGEAGCRVLVTSRRVLSGIGDAMHLHLAALPPGEATELLAHLAGSWQAARHPAAIAEIARRCGYLPLALRLAAGRLARRPGWSLRLLADRLADDNLLDELCDDYICLRASLDVSYQELATSDDELDLRAARSLRLLGLLNAAEVGAGVAARLFGVLPWEAERVLDRLVDVGFLQATAAGRYLVNDLVIRYASELAVACLPGEPLWALGNLPELELPRPLQAEVPRGQPGALGPTLRDGGWAPGLPAVGAAPGAAAGRMRSRAAAVAVTAITTPTMAAVA